MRGRLCTSLQSPADLGLVPAVGVLGLGSLVHRSALRLRLGAADGRMLARSCLTGAALLDCPGEFALLAGAQLPTMLRDGFGLRPQPGPRLLCVLALRAVLVVRGAWCVVLGVDLGPGPSACGLA